MTDRMTYEEVKLPWSVEDTIENLKEIKEHFKIVVQRTNLHGKGEEDAKEIDFDFERAIEALEKQIPKNPVEIITDDNEYPYDRCPSCKRVLYIGQPYCDKCGRAIDWRSKLYSLSDRDCEFAIPQNKAIKIVKAGGKGE